MRNQMSLRAEPSQADIENVRDIIISTGFFQNHEIDVAVELVEERLQKGIESGYFFIFVEIDGRTVAYACYGTIPCTIGSWDLYWIATHNNFRGKGIGKKLLAEVEKHIKELGGRTVYIETSLKPQYEPTQYFYDSAGYAREAVLKDFYDVNDHKVIYSRVL
jgi:ribosomal protein S18 acetylase RimI-like enzyme